MELQKSGEKLMENKAKIETKTYRLECKYSGAGLTHYVMQSEDSPL
jgi:modified peptide precursor CbpA